MAVRGRWCRTRIGNIFLIIVVVAIVLFALTYFYGLDSFFHKERKEIHTDLGPIRHHRKHHRRAGKKHIQVCPRPKIDLEHDVIKGAFHRVAPLRCTKTPLFYIKDGAIRVNQTVIRGKKVVKCVYRAIERMVDSMYQYSNPHTRYKGPFELKIKHDFFRVQCYVGDEKPGRELKQVQSRADMHPAPVNDGGAGGLYRAPIDGDRVHLLPGNRGAMHQAGIDDDSMHRAPVNDDDHGSRHHVPIQDGNVDDMQPGPVDDGKPLHRVAENDAHSGIRRQDGHSDRELNPISTGRRGGRVQSGTGRQENDQKNAGRRGLDPDSLRHPEQRDEKYRGQNDEGYNTRDHGVGASNVNRAGDRLNRAGNVKYMSQDGGNSNARQPQLNAPGKKLDNQPDGDVVRKRNPMYGGGRLSRRGPGSDMRQGRQLNPVRRDEKEIDAVRNRELGVKSIPVQDGARMQRDKGFGKDDGGPYDGRNQGRQGERTKQRNAVPNAQNPSRQPSDMMGRSPNGKNVPSGAKLDNRYDTSANRNKPADAVRQPHGQPIGREAVIGKGSAPQYARRTTTTPAFEDSEESSDSDAPDYDQFFAHVHPKKEVFERINELRPKGGAKQMNLLMVILDSLSHMSWRRKLPQTYCYLRNSLGSVILDGYNIIGDGTTANIVALLTGKRIEELPETRKSQSDSTYVDRYPLLWFDYEKKGYVTLFAEDEPTLGTFNLRLNGFEKPPTDHYMRQFWQAIWDSSLNKNSPRFCLGEKPKHQYMLDYGKDFFVKYHNVSKFGVLFHGELTHADNNPGEHIDADFVKFLVALKCGGYLDNTLLIVMSDHGARYSTVRHTIQGKLEERLPLMSMTFPKWFQKKYSKQMNHLRGNVGKLTTPFDIYETLNDVLDMKRVDAKADPNARGMSVLRSIPLSRTCATAGIPMHWCTCLRYEELDTKDWQTKKIAEALVAFINELTSEHRDECHELHLSNVFDAKMIIPNEQLLKYYNSLDNDHRIANFTKKALLDSAHIQMTVDTAPNNALYEGTVFVNFKDVTFKVDSEISRINMYDNEPHCVIEKYPELRKFCYCKKSYTKPPTSKTYV